MNRRLPQIPMDSVCLSTLTMTTTEVLPGMLRENSNAINEHSGQRETPIFSGLVEQVLRRLADGVVVMDLGGDQMAIRVLIEATKPACESLSLESRKATVDDFAGRYPGAALLRARGKSARRRASTRMETGLGPAKAAPAWTKRRGRRQ